MSGTCASTDFRDGAGVTVELGEGSADWPETDWNAVGLGELGRLQKGSWQLESVADLPQVLNSMGEQLESIAPDFLRGDPARFRTTRARQTRRRQPYKIFEPDARGRYRSHIEPESAALKERYERND